MGGLEGTFKRFGSQLLGLAGIGGGLYGLKRGFDVCIEAAMESEKVQTNLASSLQATGEYSDETMQRLIRFAHSMQDITTWSNEAVLGLAEYVHTLGIGAYQIEEATRMTLGLSKALRVDEQASAKMAAAAMQGHFEKFTRYIPAIKDARTEAERFALVQEKVKIGLEIATGELNTTAGATLNVKNQLHDAAASLGTFFTPVWEGAIVVLREASIALEAVLKPWNEIQEAIKKQRGIPLMEIVPPGYKKEDFLPPAEELEKWNRLMDQWPGAIPRIHSMDVFLQQMEVLHQAQADYNAEFENWYETGQYIGEIEAEWQAYTEELDKAALAQNQLAVITEATWPNFVRLGEAAIGAGVKVKTAAEEMADAAKEVADKWRQVGMTMEYSATSAIDSMIWEGEKWRDAMTGFARDVLREMMRVFLIKPLVSGIGMMMGFPAAVGHQDGIIGETAFPMRMMPAWAFAEAPRLHAGLAADEFPAILQRGEKVTPRGAGQNVTVNINNQSGTPLSAEGKSRVDGRQMIIDIVVDDYYRHGRTYGLR